MIVFFIIFAVVIAFIAWIYWPQIIGAGWSPTPMVNVEKMLLMAEVKEDDVVYDLGCGDGRIITAAASKFGAKAVGIEADPLRFLFSWVRVKLLGLGDRVKVMWGNFFACSLADATVVTVFLSDTANNKLEYKLQKELAAGTRVVSYYWIFPGWKPLKIDHNHRLYLYVIGG